MSYDLTAWFPVTPVVDSVLADYPGATTQGDHVVITFPDSQILIFGPHACEPEDIPEEILAANPLVRHLIEISVEPMSAPASVRTKALKIMKALCKAYDGTALDPQTDLIYGRKKRATFVASAEEREVSELSISWWYRSPVLRSRDGWERLLTLFDKYLPEAIPRRYGEFEPPNFRLDRDGRDHFIDFVTGESQSKVIYTDLPVTGIHHAVPDPFGPHILGYRVDHLEIRMLSDCLTHQARQQAVKQLWLEVSKLLNPFYGDVRHLGGRTMQRKRIWFTSHSANHPIISWWWRGLPTTLGIATVVGEPYLSLWPEFSKNAQRVGELALISGEDWLNCTDPTASNIKVPVELASPTLPPIRFPTGVTMPTDHHGRLATEAEVWACYPKKWPFEFPVIIDQK